MMKTIFIVNDDKDESKSVLAGISGSLALALAGQHWKVLWQRALCRRDIWNPMASKGLENQLKELAIEETNCETKVLLGEGLPLASVGSEQAKAEKECVGILLEAKDENNLEVALVCSHCKKANPSKRCAKRHMKCLQKIFCNETCEMLSHKKKEDPNADNSKTETAKKVDAKKKKTKEKKKENMKHGHVRASIAYKDYE